MSTLFVNQEKAQTAQVADFFCVSAAPYNRLSILDPNPPAEMVDAPATLWHSINHWHQFTRYSSSIRDFIKELVTSEYLKSYLVHKSENRRYTNSFGHGYNLKNFYTFHPDTNIVVVFVDSIGALSNLSTKVSHFVNHSFNYHYNNISAHIFANTTAGDGDVQKLNTIVVAIYNFGKE